MITLWCDTLLYHRSLTRDRSSSASEILVPGQQLVFKCLDPHAQFFEDVEVALHRRQVLIANLCPVLGIVVLIIVLEFVVVKVAIFGLHSLLVHLGLIESDDSEVRRVQDL